MEVPKWVIRSLASPHPPPTTGREAQAYSPIRHRIVLTGEPIMAPNALGQGTVTGRAVQPGRDHSLPLRGSVRFWYGLPDMIDQHNGGCDSPESDAQSDARQISQHLNASQNTRSLLAFWSKPIEVGPQGYLVLFLIRRGSDVDDPKQNLHRM
ncbi:hypothetical protein BO71DRAFT_428542 [Aspergillus ellipticus CBS 707.79]|uniref:Uncharacterized protein n=1 Tax=Aspergillus ellipticus CBS 707.79 TaxID=1448320 RepID=A0A319EWI3_9EURO|nr:hypothetical protein BO71DRAFT_428542 [Aspergillus ellipticus CBS 707.79]